MSLHRAFTAIQRDHQQNGRLPYCTGCDRLITDHAAHIADLQIAYLRERFALTPIQKHGDKGWPVDPDDDDFRVLPVHLADQTGRELAGCQVSWGSFELNLSPTHAENLAGALLSTLHHIRRSESNR